MLWALLHVLPKSWISRMAGRVASMRLPPILQRAEIRFFVRLAGADPSEAAEPIEAYPTLQSFFTRSLAPGRRPLDPDPTRLLAPCDGRWGASGRVEEGTILQVKGIPYAIGALLGDEARATALEGGHYATFYLSPRDYHRFHTPIAGRFERIDYWPGALWPVNRIGLQGVDGLFARNERVCAYLRSSTEGAEASTGWAVLVAVGATIVGSVRLTFDELRTNVSGARPLSRDYGDTGPRFARGEEWGHFAFGSTIVLLTPPGRFEIDHRPSGTPLQLGEAIGRSIR